MYSPNYLATFLQFPLTSSLLCYLMNMYNPDVRYVLIKCIAATAISTYVMKRYSRFYLILN